MRTEQTLLHGLVLQTRDPEEAAECLRDAAVPYTSELLPGSPPFSTQIFITPGQRLNLARVVTRGAMQVHARLPKDSYALVLDLGRGVGEHRINGDTIMVGPEFAFVQSPLEAVDIRTESDYEVLFMRISRQGMIEELQNLLQQETRSNLVFEPALRLANEAGRKLRQICDALRRTLYATDDRNVRQSPALRQLESDLMTLLLQAQPHNYRRFLHRKNDAGTWHLVAAEEYMRASAHLPISLGEVCRAAGVNARTLQDSFRKKRGCTPMEFLRNIRMEQVRTGLLQPGEQTSVAGEAARWGFLHFGRFSSEYRARFGELPSETLRRSRKHPVAATR